LPAGNLEAEFLRIKVTGPATSWLRYTTSCKHSLVLLKMGEMIARNILSWLELLVNRYCCIQLVAYIICFMFVSWNFRFAADWEGNTLR